MAAASSGPSDPTAILFNVVLGAGLVFGTMVVFYEEPWNQVDAAALGSDMAVADSNDPCAALLATADCSTSHPAPVLGHSESPATDEREDPAENAVVNTWPPGVVPDPPADGHEKERSPGEAHAEKGETKPLKVDKKVNPEKEKGEEKGQRKAFGKEVDKVAGGAERLGNGADGKHDKKS